MSALAQGAREGAVVVAACAVGCCQVELRDVLLIHVCAIAIGVEAVVHQQLSMSRRGIETLPPQKRNSACVHASGSSPSSGETQVSST